MLRRENCSVLKIGGGLCLTGFIFVFYIKKRLKAAEAESKLKQVYIPN